MAVQFYYGVDTLTLRSGLPFSNMSGPACMLVRENGDAIAGSGVTSGVMVAKAILSDNYGSWSDLTANHSTSSAIQALGKTDASA